MVAAILGLILLFKGLNAGSIPSPASNRPCANFILPVSATAHHAEYNIVHVDNNIDATAYAVDLDTWSFDQPSRVLRNITVSDTYNISVQLCVPKDRHKKQRQHLLLATHGGLFDKRYWDSAIDPSQYSFVDAALAAGYSILTYDRLGTGLSDKPDAYTIVQAPIQLEILRGITNMARSREILKHIGGSAGNTNSTASTSFLDDSSISFDKIIHVGHSFGSVLTSAFLATYGNLSDAAVITGYILNEHFPEQRKTAFGLEYAPHNDPSLFSNRPSGYMVDGTPSSFQNIFFSTKATSGIGGFDPKIFDYAFSIRQTITAAEFLGPALDLQGPAPAFRGPLQFVLAEFDFPICRGDCRLKFDREAMRKMYPNAAGDIDIYTQPGNGHALTMHLKANLGFKATLDWLGKNGL